MMILVAPPLSVLPPTRGSKRVYQSNYCGAVCKIDQISDFDAQEATPKNHRRRRCECYDLCKELVPYKDAWSWQKSIVRSRHALMETDEDHSDTLIILQHPPVYTLGTGSLEEYLNFEIENAPFDVYRTERGGEVTYHGPGQDSFKSNSIASLLVSNMREPFKTESPTMRLMANLYLNFSPLRKKHFESRTSWMNLQNDKKNPRIFKETIYLPFGPTHPIMMSFFR